jgi:DNA-binding transcriptional ArsR family regulator
MAWSHYYLGEYERALGLLIALDAPAYRQLIAPERFLLEALSLRYICQFEPARRAAVRLRASYGDAIKDLYDGVPIKESSSLRRAARLRTAGKGVGEFRVLMDTERQRIDDLEDTLGPEFAKHLRVIYDEGIVEASRREDEELTREMQAVARELLNSEEGVRLILHELGVALLRGRRRPPGSESRLQIQETFTEQDILYRFEGEFWTDELDDLVVTMEDRCID